MLINIFKFQLEIFGTNINHDVTIIGADVIGPVIVRRLSGTYENFLIIGKVGSFGMAFRLEIAKKYIMV